MANRIILTILFSLFLIVTHAQEAEDINRATIELSKNKNAFETQKEIYNKELSAYKTSLETEVNKKEMHAKYMEIAKDSMRLILGENSVAFKYYLQKKISEKTLKKIFNFPSDLSDLEKIPSITPFKNRYSLYNSTLEEVLSSDYRYSQNAKNVVVVQQELLNNTVSEIFNQVVFANDNLVNNASAFGYSQNEEKTSLSTNTNFRLRKNSTKGLGGTYGKVGLSAVGKGANFNLYSRDTWSQSTGVSLGLVFGLHNASIGIKKGYNQPQFENDQISRKLQAKLRIQKINDLELNKENLISIKNALIALDEPTKVLNTYKELTNKTSRLNSLITKNEYVKAVKHIDSLVSDVALFTALQEDKKEYESYIRKELTAYDTKYNPLTGNYTLGWFDLGASINHSAFSFTEEFINPLLIESIEEDERKKSRALITAGANYNLTNKTEKNLFYLQLGATYTAGSFLNSNLIVGTPTISEPLGSTFIIVDEEGTTLGSYDRVTKPLQYVDFHAYGAIFFTKLKNFGFNINLKHNFLVDQPINTLYKNNFTLLGGPIFRTIKGKSSGATFGLDIGFENAAYDTNIQDEFTARLRVGIPFNIYTKKKDTK